MKKIILATVALIVFAGCVKDLPYEDIPIPIQFNAGLSAVNTRAPLSNLNSLSGIQVLRAPDGESADFSGATSVTITASTDAGGDVTVTPAQYYNATPTLKAWFLSFYPAGAMGTGKVSWTIDGTQDIIATGSVDAGSKSSPNAVDLGFGHKLSQIQFEVIAASEAAQTYWGTLTSISVSSVTEIELTFPSTLGSTGSASALPTTGFTSPLTIPFSEPAASAGNVIIYPVETLGEVKVLTSTMGGVAQTASISLTAGAVAGSAHLITITFGEQGAISFTASLTPWATGATGTGSL